ncbi:MAG TPA: hypothetical protein VLC98_11510 [Phnomibacter sp.]|nr:hypothetical protein [Phnomibacter sp.]
MKLDYNILWLDNDLIDYINNGGVDSIKEFLIEKGFEPNIVTVFDESELDKYLNISYDLIISDFNLNKENGDVVIYRLREENKLDTEILFYSAKSNFMQDADVKNRLAFMERINIQIGRDTLLEKIEKVIELTVRKLFELNATRGLITAATSDLDVELETLSIAILRNLLNKSDDELNAIMDNYVTDFLAKNPDKFIERHQKIGFDSSFKFIEAFRKWGIFRDSLKELSKSNSANEIKNFLEFNKTYFEDVIKVRNKFAHAKAEKNGHKVVLKGQIEGEDFEFDTAMCIEIRKNLILHKREIENLKAFLSIE